jgi:hypothetical protein
VRGVRSFQDPGPQHHQVSSGSSDLRGTHGTQLGHLGVSLIADVNKQGLNPSICERQNHFGNRHRVTARGHLEKKGTVQKGAKGVESSLRKDEAPGCKDLMKHCYSGYAWTLETSCLMDVSFFHVFVYTVLEKLGIGESSRVVTVIG